MDFIEVFDPFLHYTVFLVVKFARITLVWLQLLLFTALSVIGEGWHRLPGLGHSCGCSDISFGSESDKRHECHDAGSCFSSEKDNIVHHRTLISSVANDCPVCRFIATAKPLVEKHSHVFSIEFRASYAERPTTAADIRSLDAYLSRGPPSA